METRVLIWNNSQNHSSQHSKWSVKASCWWIWNSIFFSDSFSFSVCSRISLSFRSCSSIFRSDKRRNDTLQADHSRRSRVLVFFGRAGCPGRRLYSPSVLPEKAAGKDGVKCHLTSSTCHLVHPASPGPHTHNCAFLSRWAQNCWTQTSSWSNVCSFSLSQNEHLYLFSFCFSPTLCRN